MSLTQADPREFVDWVNRLPLAQTFGITCVQAGHGRTTMQVAEAPFAPNPNGAVHGGIISALVDHVMGTTVLSILAPRTAAVTATLTVNYLAPAVVPLTFHTRVVRASRALIFAETEVISGGTPVDTACGTFVPRDNYLLDPGEAPDGTVFYALTHPHLPPE